MLAYLEVDQYPCAGLEGAEARDTHGGRGKTTRMMEDPIEVKCMKFLEIRAVEWRLGWVHRDTFPLVMCRSQHLATFSSLVGRPSVHGRSEADRRQYHFTPTDAKRKTWTYVSAVGGKPSWA